MPQAYPADLSLTVWICFVGTVEGAVVALIAERQNTAAWKLKWDMELLAVFYNVRIFRVLSIHIYSQLSFINPVYLLVLF